MLLIYSPYIVEYKFPLYPHQNHIKTHQNHDIVSPHPDGYAIHVPPFSVQFSHIQQFPPLKKPAFFQRFARFASPKHLPRSQVWPRFRQRKARSPWAKAPQSSSRLTSAMHIRKASTSMPLASVSSMSSMNWVKKVTSRIFGGFLKGISWSNVLG